MAGTAVIEVRGLTKAYGDVEAVRGIDLRADAGEVFAILGPNGAGKTTTVEILEGFRERDGGGVSVLGCDPWNAGRAWRSRVGIVLQDCRLEPELTVRESLAKHAGYHDAPRGVDETIELTGLSGKADERARRLSGGQQRRLDVALALIGDPELLFLDEPTTGFDPEARREFWDVISDLRTLGKTIVLTTHYMDEAQVLADRLAIVAAGRIVAAGTAAEIGALVSTDAVVSFSFEGDDGQLPPGAESLSGGRRAIATADPLAVAGRLASLHESGAARIEDLEVRRPTLEDAYLQLIGERTDTP